jgi:hypothetical protein
MFGQLPVLKIDQEGGMGALVLACGNTALDDRSPVLTELGDIDTGTLPSRPGKADLDAHLAELGTRRLVIVGTDADLASVVQRLLRKERLADVVLGFVPTDPASEVARLWRLPDGFGPALEHAINGEVEPIPLIRDDTGGVLVGLGRIGPVRGVAYCDDTTALRGKVSRIEVTPNPEGGSGLVARVIRSGLLGKRVTTLHGRAFQLGCLPTPVTTDGETRPRPVSKWTWYRHTADLRAVRGAS